MSKLFQNGLMILRRIRRSKRPLARLWTKSITTISFKSIFTPKVKRKRKKRCKKLLLKVVMDLRRMVANRLMEMIIVATSPTQTSKTMTPTTMNLLALSILKVIHRK